MFRPGISPETRRLTKSRPWFRGQPRRAIAAGLGIGLIGLPLVFSGAAQERIADARRQIRVVMDNVYAPYSFQSDKGEMQGILVDQWRAWETKTGIKVDIHGMDWAEALRRMRAGDFDVIETIVETTERREYFDFTSRYATVEVPIFFHKDVSGITDITSLKGFPVGVKAGDQHVESLREQGVSTLIAFPNYEAIIEAAKQRKINVFVADAPSALYLLNKARLDSQFRHSQPIFRDGLQRAVRKGNTELLSLISEGFASIESSKLAQIDEKWFGRTIHRLRPYLVYGGWAAAFCALLIVALVMWNRALGKTILQRTAALAESEQRFRQMAENTQEVFWLVTAGFKDFLYVSPAYGRIWGRSCESLYKEPQSFITGIHPEDRPRVVEALKKNHDCGFDLEYRVVRPDGSIRWIWDRGFPIKNEQGGVYRLAGIAEDITERRQVQAERERLFEYLRAARERTQRLSKQVLIAHEAERRHFSRALHDETSQTLTALKIALDLMRSSLETAAPLLLKKFDEIVRFGDLALDQVRSLAESLGPQALSTIGLVACLEDLCLNISQRSQVMIKWRCATSPRISDTASFCLYRFLQEILVGVSKSTHREVQVELIVERHTVGLFIEEISHASDAVSVMKECEENEEFLAVKQLLELFDGSVEGYPLPNHGRRIVARVPLHTNV